MSGELRWSAFFRVWATSSRENVLIQGWGGEFFNIGVDLLDDGV